MHDTDMAGVLYFANQFRFVHDAFEDYMANIGFPFQSLFTERDFGFVIRHAEADYLVPLTVGDALEIHLAVEKIGNTSFTMAYEIYRNKDELVGRAKTVHVTVDRVKKIKISIPESLRGALED